MTEHWRERARRHDRNADYCTFMVVACVVGSILVGILREVMR